MTARKPPHLHNRCRKTPEQFWADVKRTDGGCWEYCGLRSSKGYGVVMFQTKRTTAHRLAYRLVVGDIPDGLHVLHRCDNPPCCNPAHLYVGTNYDNVMDKVRRGRHPHSKKTHCKHGHAFTPENTIWLKNGRNQSLRMRGCRECSKITNRRRYWVRKALGVPRKAHFSVRHLSETVGCDATFKRIDGPRPQRSDAL